MWHGISWHIVTCRDIRHISLNALAFARGDATWHKGQLSRSQMGSEPETRPGSESDAYLGSKSDKSRFKSDKYFGPSLINDLDSIRYTSHSSLSYSTITHTHTHKRRGAFQRSSYAAGGDKMKYIRWSFSSSSGKLKSVEGPWSEYPPTSYQQIFLLPIFFWGGGTTHTYDGCIMFRLSSCSNPNIGFQCRLIRSLMLCFCKAP